MLTRNGYRSARIVREKSVYLSASMKRWSCFVNHISGNNLSVDQVAEEFEHLQAAYLDLKKIVESLDNYPVADPGTFWGRFRLLICDLISRISK
jgi:hypothetical protein